MRTAIINKLLFLAGALVTSVILLHWLTAGTDNIVWGSDKGSSEDIMAIRPAAENSAADLMAKHDCWMGEAPADMVGVIPGHSVVTMPSGRTVYAGTLVTGHALDQMFGGKDYGLKVHGFCR